MSTFKAGDRARIVGQSGKADKNYVIGMEVVIVRPAPNFYLRDWIVDFGRPMHDCISTSLSASEGCFFSRELAPLTDPKADIAFEGFMVKVLHPVEIPA